MFDIPIKQTGRIKGMGGHQSSNADTDTWLTPPSILEALGRFDLDPCTPEIMPWETAGSRYTIKDDGLKSKWFGRVFCNPPYSLEAQKWLAKCADHKNAIALIFARTETKGFFEQVWGKADSVLFIKGRLTFYKADGKIASANAGAPSVLISYDKANSLILMNSKIAGKFIQLK